MTSTMYLSIVPLFLMALTSCVLAWDFNLVPWDLHPLEDPPPPMEYSPHHLDYHPPLLDYRHPPMDYPHPPMENHPMAYPPMMNPRMRHPPPAMGPTVFGHHPSLSVPHEHPPPNRHLPYPANLPPPPSEPRGPPNMWGANGKFMPFSGSENVLRGEAHPERFRPPRPEPVYASRTAGRDDLGHADSPRPAHIMDHPMARDLMAAILIAARRGHSDLADKTNAPAGFGGERASRAVPLDSGTHTKLELMVIERLLAFKSKMNASQSDLGLPALDPFVLDKYSFHIQNSTMQISGQLENTRMVGLSMFNVEKLKLYLIQRLGVVQISIPKLEMRIGYNIDNGSWFTPLKIPFYGAGELRLELGPLDTLVRAEVFIHDKQLGMQSLSIDYKFGDVKCALQQQSPQGSFTDNPHLDELMARVVVDLVPRMASEWRPALEKQIALKLDEELKHLNWKDIFENFD